MFKPAKTEDLSKSNYGLLSSISNVPDSFLSEELNSITEISTISKSERALLKLSLTIILRDELH